MSLLGIIISTVVAAVLCLEARYAICRAYLNIETTEMTRRPREEWPGGIGATPLTTREHWMRHANQALSELASPCPFAAFGSVIVNHTDTSLSPLGRLLCAGVNSGGRRGNPTLHGEMDAINRCSEVLQSPPFDLAPESATKAFRDLTLYTNAEPCPMCASAIRWAGFRECVYGTSIDTLIKLGWTQIDVPSGEIFARSGRLPTSTALLPNVLTAETNPFFAWQYNKDAPCPGSCNRADTGTCVPVYRSRPEIQTQL
ncbi:cytidine deaminase-like protein [Xylariaceae sp. FL0594]|nr:cytidine deaminase-like protein [Xylariaceae sp. FL0594]